MYVGTEYTVRDSIYGAMHPADWLRFLGLPDLRLQKLGILGGK